jgi:hypothetical protein
MGTIYIASSWRNQHAVEMLTELLRQKAETETYDLKILSFVEKAVTDEGRGNWKFDFEEWIRSDDGLKKFKFDVKAAMESDILIYVGPSGTDAWAQVGAAYGAAVHIIGLWAKSEPAGLMRRMMDYWVTDYKLIIKYVDYFFKEKEKNA